MELYPSTFNHFMFASQHRSAENIITPKIEEEFEHELDKHEHDIDSEDEEDEELIEELHAELEKETEELNKCHTDLHNKIEEEKAIKDKLESIKNQINSGQLSNKAGAIEIDRHNQMLVLIEGEIAELENKLIS